MSRSRKRMQRDEEFQNINDCILDSSRNRRRNTIYDEEYVTNSVGNGDLDDDEARRGSDRSYLLSEGQMDSILKDKDFFVPKICSFSSNFVDEEAVPEESIVPHLNISEETWKFNFNDLFRQFSVKFDDLSFNFQLFEKLFKESRHTIFDMIYFLLSFKKKHLSFNNSMMDDLLKMISFFFPQCNLKKTRKGLFGLLCGDGLDKFFHLIPCCSHSKENKKESSDPEKELLPGHIFCSNILKKRIKSSDCICPSCGKMSYKKNKNGKFECKEHFLFIPPAVILDNFDFEDDCFQKKIDDAKFEYEKRINIFLKILPLQENEKLVKVLWSRDDVPIASCSGRAVCSSGFSVSNSAYFTTLSEKMSNRNLMNFFVSKYFEYLWKFRPNKPLPISCHDQHESAITRELFPVTSHCPLYFCPIEIVKYPSKKTRNKNGTPRMNTIRCFSKSSSKPKNLKNVLENIIDEEREQSENGIYPNIQSFSILQKYGWDCYSMESIDSFHNLANIFDYSKNHVISLRLTKFCDQMMERSKSPVEMTRFRKVSTKLSELKNTEKVFLLEKIIPICAFVLNEERSWKFSKIVLVDLRKMIVYSRMNNDDLFKLLIPKVVKDIRCFFKEKKEAFRFVPSLHSFLFHSLNTKEKFGKIYDTEIFESEYSLFRNIAVGEENIYLTSLGYHIISSLMCDHVGNSINAETKKCMNSLLRGEKRASEKELLPNEHFMIILKIKQQLNIEGIWDIKRLNKVSIDGIDKFLVRSFKYQMNNKSSNYDIAVETGGVISFARVEDIISCFDDGWKYSVFLNVTYYSVLGFVSSSSIPILSIEPQTTRNEWIRTDRVFDIILLLKDHSLEGVNYSIEKFTQFDSINEDKRCFPIFLTKEYRYFEDIKKQNESADKNGEEQEGED